MFELLFGLKLSPPLLLKLEHEVELSILSVRSAKSSLDSSNSRLLCDSKLYPHKSTSDLGLIAFSALVFGLVDRKCQYCRKAIRFKSGRFERTILKKSLH
ncbi:hypothetical protein K1719_035838 [Acacia pycnantha]|nr:hypothetical protein K1719_035838 [Acacia pycnantha]